MSPRRADRPRDSAGRPQSDRPRDSLGRPLPRGAERGSAVAQDGAVTQDGAVAREPESVVRTAPETIARARELLDANLPFNAHDVFEAAWKNGPPPERDLWQGLAQLCVAMTHVARGNPSGARALFVRGADRLRRYSAGGLDTHGLDLAAVVTWAESAGVLDDDDLPATGLPLPR